PFGNIPLLVQIPVVFPLLSAAPQRRNYRLGSARLDDGNERVAVGAFIGDHPLRLMISQQFLSLFDVRPLAGSQFQLNGVSQRIDTSVDFRGKSATATAEGLLGLATAAVPLFLAPAAAECARTVVESRISHSKSSSRNTVITLAQTPRAAQRS